MREHKNAVKLRCALISVVQRAQKLRDIRFVARAVTGIARGVNAGRAA